MLPALECDRKNPLGGAKMIKHEQSSKASGGTGYYVQFAVFPDQRREVIHDLLSFVQ
jgi:hypothetical protein